MLTNPLYKTPYVEFEILPSTLTVLRPYVMLILTILTLTLYFNTVTLSVNVFEIKV